MSGKRYFYALGQSARARGVTKYCLDALHRGLPQYARIAMDAGYRGLTAP